MTEKEHARRPNWVIKAEVHWWLMRPGFYSHVALIGAAGWFAAGGGISGGLWLVIAIVACARGLSSTLNDLNDLPKDKVTAPQLPLPSGLMTVQAARIQAVLLVLITTGCVAALSGGLSDFLLLEVLFLDASLFSWIYSRFKHHGLRASFYGGWASSHVPIVAWLAGPVHEHRNVVYLLLLVVFVYALEVSLNQVQAIRDVDSDGLVGNLTVPVRIGARGALRISARFAVLGGVAALVIVLLRPGGWWSLLGLPLLLVTLVRGRSAYVEALPSMDIAGRGRGQRNIDVKKYARAAYFWQMAAMICAFHVVFGAVACIVLRLLNKPQARRYQDAVYGGGLLRGLSLRQRAAIHVSAEA